MFLMKSITVQGLIKGGLSPFGARPDSFSFEPVSNADPSSSYVASAPITGLSRPVIATVQGGEIGVSSGDPPSSWGTSAMVQANDRLFVRVLAASGYQTATTAVVRVGSFTAPFLVTTRAADLTPNTFAFDAVSGASPGTLYTASARIVDIDAPVAASVVGGQIGRSTTADTPPSSWGTSLTVQPNDYVFVRAYSPSDDTTTANAVVTVGGVSATFSIANREIGWMAWTDEHTVTNAVAATSVTFDSAFEIETTDLWRFADFGFTSVLTDVDPGTYIYAYVPVNMSDLTATITGGEMVLSTSNLPPNSDWTTSPVTTVTDRYLHLRVLSSESYGQWSNAALTFSDQSGPVASGTFSTFTRSFDTIPNSFAFPPVTGATLSSVNTASAQITGILDAAQVTTTAGEIAVSSTPTAPTSGWTTESLSVTNYQYVFVRLTASDTLNTTTTATVTVGGVSGVFSVTTSAFDTTPDSFELTSLTSMEPSAQATTSAIRITGISIPVTATTTLGEVAVATTTTAPATGWANSVTVNNDEYLFARMTASSSFDQTVSANVTVGTVSRSWSLTTRPATADWMLWNNSSSTNYTSNSTSATFDGFADFSTIALWSYAG